jgi:hypothetical protein
VDVTEDIKKLRANLTTFVQQNSIDEILRVSQKLLDWIPQDFVARYFFAYSKQQQNQPRFMYEFYQSPPTYTDDEITFVLAHINQHSDLRDKRRVLDFLSIHHEDGLSAYFKIHKEREDRENHYANVPRDVFVCFSSYNVGIAEKVVKELETDGNTCWISTRNLRPNDSENYWKNIENAIQNSTIVLVLGSEDSMRSKDVHQEIDFARKHQKKIIEFKIDEAQHNTLFKHVFNGIKWVKGTLDVNQNYTVLLERIYEERYQHPRLEEQELLNEELIETADVIEEFVSADEFIESAEDELINDGEYVTEEDTEKILVDDVFFRQQSNEHISHLSTSIHSDDRSIDDKQRHSTRLALWIFTIIGLIVFFGFLVNFATTTYSNRTLNTPTINPGPTPTSPSTNDNQVISDGINNANDSLNIRFFESIRTFEPISIDEFFIQETSDIMDSIILSNGDIATLGLKEESGGYSLYLSFFDSERNNFFTIIPIADISSNSVQIWLNREFFKLYQADEDKLIVSYVNASPSENLGILEIGFYVSNLQGVFIDQKVYTINNHEVGRSWSIDSFIDLFNEKEIVGNPIGLHMAKDNIFIITSIMKPNVEPDSLYVSYKIDKFFDVKNLVASLNPDNRIIHRTISSSFEDNATFIGTEYVVFNDDQPGVIREQQLFNLIINKDGFPMVFRLGSESVLYEQRRFMANEAMNLGSIEASVLRKSQLYYIASYYELNPSGIGYLPGQYYLGRDQFGRLGFEVNINDMLSDLIVTTNSAGLSFNGMYYDELLEHLVLDITFLPTENSVSSVRYNVFVSLDGELIGIQEFNWRNGSILSPKYPHYVYNDGTILSTSQRGILIQRVKD